VASVATARYNGLVEPTLRVIHGGKEPAREPHAEPALTELSGWGMCPRVQGRQRLSENLERITDGAILTRGLGRSYGDASLPPPGGAPVAGSVLADRVLAFDLDSGVLRAEAGLPLMRLNQLSLPRGWFTPVTPGTHWVTLGGMVAADVHGKSHHTTGCFGAHVRSLRMRVADGRILECSPTLEPELFRATVGGMGLTGHILEVEFTLARLPSPWIWGECQRIPDIDAFIAGLKEAGTKWPFTVGWIDCLSGGSAMGRGILTRGRWAEPFEAPRAFPRDPPRLTVPFVLPEWVLSRLSIRAFNEVYYRVPRKRRGIWHPDAFWYPLDMILHWNRIYGRRGFTQYQCVLPESAGRGSARRFLELLTSKGGASFLCVIKDCGAEGQGLLSFPKPGISIALDMAVRDDTQAIVDALNERVIAEGGRVYLAKDTFTRPEHFRAMEPRLPEFQRIRRLWDPEGRLKSAQSVRLLGDTP
jgi:FAD/FMN-containing dehydrogenase